MTTTITRSELDCLLFQRTRLVAPYCKINQISLSFVVSSFVLFAAATIDLLQRAPAVKSAVTPCLFRAIVSQTPPEPPILDSAASLGDGRSHLCPTRRFQGPRDVGIGRRHHLRPRNRLKIDMWKLLPPHLAEYLLNQRISLKNWTQTRKVELKGYISFPNPPSPLAADYGVRREVGTEMCELCGNLIFLWD